MGEQGLLLRQNQQYHWHNAGYATFDDFLAALSSGRRKTIRRERRDAVKGLEIVCLTGADLTEDALGRLLRASTWTPARANGAAPISTGRFFSLLGERMADRVLLIMARRDGPLDRRRAQPDRRRLPLRPQLGLRRGRALPAFRALLLPGHRARHRGWPGPGRGRRAGPAQDRPRLPAHAPSIPPTTSPTPRCARRSRASWSRSGARCRARWTGWRRNIRRSGRSRREPGRRKSNCAATTHRLSRSGPSTRRPWPRRSRTVSFGGSGTPPSPSPRPWRRRSTRRLACARRRAMLPFAVIDPRPAGRSA